MAVPDPARAQPSTMSAAPRHGNTRVIFSAVLGDHQVVLGAPDVLPEDHFRLSTPRVVTHWLPSVDLSLRASTLMPASRL